VSTLTLVPQIYRWVHPVSEWKDMIFCFYPDCPRGISLLSQEILSYQRRRFRWLLFSRRKSFRFDLSFLVDSCHALSLVLDLSMLTVEAVATTPSSKSVVVSSVYSTTTTVQLTDTEPSSSCCRAIFRPRWRLEQLDLWIRRGHWVNVRSCRLVPQFTALHLMWSFHGDGEIENLCTAESA
jgi:hypothetical protein